ncbi:sulfur-oxidizing protein SoxY [Rhodovulum sp. ES.010]|uniref:quinoprotein dehydrogenase-associated SoxYZ-like carrier n=1 Tax=Rhodovulum sp. ES.010 TaxID=1882821 RepID=UPI00092B1D18|nr:quinoprotein dehydrogenase-associated SoxYZ-like carrier [Rhodovulum sp. ES.010]SIO47271.1 sulfur-oxidizing protein SoxY [Rhodovulum sp. ES.010]
MSPARLPTAAALCLSVVMLAAPVTAATAWEDIRASLYGDRPITEAGTHIAVESPYRTGNDARTPIGIRVTGPNGRLVDRVSVILDENPMPVSAVLDLARPMPSVFFEVTLRFNGPTPLHVVAETADGQLYVTEAFVKTSGQGACAAPPGTDPDAALASLGEMTIEMQAPASSGDAAARLGALAGREARVDVNISHPSHSGLQMDQISLLFIPMRYVETLDIDLDGQPYAQVTGSISLSENPRIGLSAPGATRSVGVTMTDTDGTVTRAERSLPGY